MQGEECWALRGSKAGGKVADVGCGHGASTLVMAQAFPRSEFIGFDFHDASIECASQRAREAGLNNVRFEVATAKHFPGNGYDLVAYFDCLHDMGDPVGAVAHTRKALKTDGTMLLVEPSASVARWCRSRWNCWRVRIASN